MHVPATTVSLRMGGVRRRPTADRRLATGHIVAGVAYLLLAAALMIWRGIPVTPDFLIVVLVPIAALTGRLSRFLSDWVPFVVVFLGWEALRGIAPDSDVDPHVSDWAGLEQHLFGGHLPTAELQHLVGWLGATGVVDWAATAVYFAHFAVLFAVAVAVWLVDRIVFLRLVTALLLVSLVAFAVFLVLPVAPPWLAQDLGGIAPGSFVHVIGTTLPISISPYYSSLNPNRVAAFPSLHAAFPALCLFALVSRGRRGWWFAAWCLAVWFSVVYLGEHYVVDVVGGIVLAAAGWYVVVRWIAPRVPALQRVEDAQEVQLPGRVARPVQRSRGQARVLRRWAAASGTGKEPVDAGSGPPRLELG